MNLTLGQSMQRGMPPQWYAREGYVAHLVAEVNGSNARTLCNFTEKVDELQPSQPWDRRCGTCKSKVAAMFEAVTAAPPTFVRETLTVVVVRPANAQETAAAVAKRKLGQMKSWHSIDVTVHEMEALDAPTEDES